MCYEKDSEPNTGGSLNLETILIELKEKRRALETAIAALESLKRRYRQKGTRRRGRKGISAQSKSKHRIPDTWAKAAVGAGSGEVIPFPAERRRVRLGRDSS
jgi:hypothetical protein